MPNHVVCKDCGARCSRDVDGDLVVEAMVRCTDCIIRITTENCDRQLAHSKMIKGRIFTCIRFIVLAIVLLGLGYSATHIHLK